MFNYIIVMRDDSVNDCFGHRIEWQPICSYFLLRLPEGKLHQLDKWHTLSFSVVLRWQHKRHKPSSSGCDFCSGMTKVKRVIFLLHMVHSKAFYTLHVSVESISILLPGTLGRIHLQTKLLPPIMSTILIIVCYCCISGSQNHLQQFNQCRAHQTFNYVYNIVEYIPHDLT